MNLFNQLLVNRAVLPWNKITAGMGSFKASNFCISHAQQKSQTAEH